MIALLQVKARGEVGECDPGVHLARRKMLVGKEGLLAGCVEGFSAVRLCLKLLGEGIASLPQEHAIELVAALHFTQPRAYSTSHAAALATAAEDFIETDGQSIAEADLNE